MLEEIESCHIIDSVFNSLFSSKNEQSEKSKELAKSIINIVQSGKSFSEVVSEVSNEEI